MADTSKQPQIVKATTVDKPTSVDDTAQFNYDSTVLFSISGYKTLQQINKSSIQNNIIPSSSPFILEINGSGFLSSNYTIDPFKIYAHIGVFYAVIPPLPSTSNVSHGHAYGYQVISDTTIHIYIDRLLAQKIWFIPISSTFTGKEEAYKQAIETGDSHYPFLTSIPTLQLYFVPNGNLKFKERFLDDFTDTSISLSLTQTPYIITDKLSKKKNVFYPLSIKENGEVLQQINLIGHNLSNKNVMMVKASSNILQQNTTKLPDSVLRDDHSLSKIQSLKFSDIQSLGYYKSDGFLGNLQAGKIEKLNNYDYFLPDGSVKQGDAKTYVPDKIQSQNFLINSLPEGVYYAVVYDDNGFYSYAPDAITIDKQLFKLNISDISPASLVLQSPTFTVNGFNFPTSNDFSNGATLKLSLINSSGKPFIDLQSNQLTITKKSYPNDVNGNGSIAIASDTQFSVNFSNLNYIPTPNEDTTIYLYMDVVYDKQDPNTGKINDNTQSPPITIQSQPVIKFFSTSPNQQASTNSTINIDQKTGQVIVDGTIGANKLYIVGKNFGTKDNLSVLFNGSTQQIDDLIPWNNNFSAIVVKTQANEPFKQNVNISVVSNGVSSDPLTLIPLPFAFTQEDQVKRADGVFVKNDKTYGLSSFLDNIPYDFNLNPLSKNISVASSCAVRLQNSELRQSVFLNGDLNKPVSMSFVPNLLFIPKDTQLDSNGFFHITFKVFNAFNINFSSPKIFRLQNANGDYVNVNFKPNDIMTVIGTGFTNGMRYNIHDTGWQYVKQIKTTKIDNVIYQFFDVKVPKAKGAKKSGIVITNDEYSTVASINVAAQQNGLFKVNTILIDDRYEPLLQIKQRLPGGTTLSAKGSHKIMTDKIDANMSIYSQMSPFLSIFKIVLILVRILVCVIDVICALVNPFSLIVAIIALMDCIIELLSLFPQLAVPLMILSFLQNFIGLLLTLAPLIESYITSIINTELALLQATLVKDFAALAAAEQQAFGLVKQLRDTIAYLEPALELIRIFMDLLNFAMHFPCASNQGGSQLNGDCPPSNIQQLINQMIGNDSVPSSKVFEVLPGKLIRANNVVTVITKDPSNLSVDSNFSISPGEANFPGGPKKVNSIIDQNTFTYLEIGADSTNLYNENIGLMISDDQQSTLATMFCQAVGLQTATLQTMPGFNGLDSLGNQTSPLKPGSTSVVPNLAPVLPNVSAAIECMTNLTDQIENALNSGQIFITNQEQGQKIISAYNDCMNNLINQTNQSLNDICIFAVSAINSEIKVSPKGNIGPNLNDNFIRTKLALPSTQPNDKQDSGLVLDLPSITTTTIPSSVAIDTSTGMSTPQANFGLKPDIYTPIIVQTSNKSGQRQSIDTIYFNTDNTDVGDLISNGDILEIVGSEFNGLQFPILEVQKIFTAIRLKVKLDITFEQKKIIGDKSIPFNFSDFDVKIIAHLSGNDAIAVVPADDSSVATIQIMPRDHHGHLIGTGFADKVSLKIESGEASFVPAIPSTTTDITGVIQENNNYYIAQIKSNCAGTVIISASVCGIEFVDVGYFASDPQHIITTKKKTIKILFTPPIPKLTLGEYSVNEKPQVPGTDMPN